MKERAVPLLLLAALAFLLWAPWLAPFRHGVNQKLEYAPDAVKFVARGMYHQAAVVVPIVGGLVIFHSPKVAEEAGAAAAGIGKPALPELELAPGLARPAEPALGNLGSGLGDLRPGLSSQNAWMSNYLKSSDGVYLPRSYLSRPGTLGSSESLLPSNLRYGTSSQAAALGRGWRGSLNFQTLGKLKIKNLPETHVMLGTVGTTAELNVIGKDLTEAEREKKKEALSSAPSATPAFPHLSSGEWQRLLNAMRSSPLPRPT